MKKTKWILFVSLLVSILFVLANQVWANTKTKQGLPTADRLRIFEARRLANRLGDRVWWGFNNAPFSILLVSPEREYLLFHPQPSDDFSLVGYDSLLKTDVLIRDRVFDKNLLATFPAVGGISTIVIGQPKNTDASHSTRWVITVIHEHFHQWQMSQPDYYSAVDGLELAGRDSTGMWMLDYPFPYDAKDVNEAFAIMCRRLWETVREVNGPAFRRRLEAYLKAKKRFARLVDDADYTYFLFQVWQEGIARYTELRLAEQAGDTYRPTREFKSLPDYVAFSTVAGEIRRHFLSELLRVSLKKSRRSAFYHVGAGEGLLLDRVDPQWREQYQERKFSVDEYFETDAD